jgi:hypothetical protein
VLVGITLYTELQRAALLSSLCVWYMHDTFDRCTERVSFTRRPPRRDSTSCPPQPLQSVLCSLLFVFADICFAHGSSDGRVYVSRARASLAREVSASPDGANTCVHFFRLPLWMLRFPLQGTASSRISRSDALPATFVHELTFRVFVDTQSRTAIECTACDGQQAIGSAVSLQWQCRPAIAHVHLSSAAMRASPANFPHARALPPGLSLWMPQQSSTVCELLCVPAIVRSRDDFRLPGF